MTDGKDLSAVVDDGSAKFYLGRKAEGKGNQVVSDYFVANGFDGSTVDTVI